MNLIAHFRARRGNSFPLMRAAVPGSAALLMSCLGQHELLRQAVPKLESRERPGENLFLTWVIYWNAIFAERSGELFPLFETHVDAARAEICWR
jgi:hypothetical protein